MSWFKLDDQFHSNPKVIVAGNAAVGLYCRLGTYCADKLTDGFVARKIALSMGTRAEIKALTDSPIPDAKPLLQKCDGGFRLIDYLAYNPTRESVLLERAKAKERMDRLRGRSSERTPEQQANERPKFGPGSPSPVPVPLEVQVTDISTHVDTPSRAGKSDLRINEVAGNYARIALEQARDVSNPDAYTRAARKTALNHPDIGRYLERWPTAPANAIAAWLHGDKHSMGYYHDTADDEIATVHPIHNEGGTT